MLGGTDSTHEGRKKIYLEWSKMNCSEACLGVGSYVDDNWWLVKISR
jgi:hypothetical protein